MKLKLEGMYTYCHAPIYFRTYFYNKETGKSQWIPPRFIRTPAEVQAILDATRSGMEDHSLISQPRVSERFVRLFC